MILKSKTKISPKWKSYSIKNIDINKTVVSNKVFFGKKGFKYFIEYKDSKKLDLYVYFSQKWVHTEETLMKLNKCLFK